MIKYTEYVVNCTFINYDEQANEYYEFRPDKGTVFLNKTAAEEYKAYLEQNSDAIDITLEEIEMSYVLTTN